MLATSQRAEDRGHPGPEERALQREQAMALSVDPVFAETQKGLGKEARQGRFKGCTLGIYGILNICYDTCG